MSFFSRDPINSLRIVNAVNIQNVAANGVINGNAIDVRNIEPYFGFVLKTGAYTSGNVKVKSVEFSNDITFATGVTTVDAITDLNRFVNSDSTNGQSAIQNATLSGANQLKKIGFSSPVALLSYARLVLEGASTSIMTISVDFVCNEPFVAEKLQRQGL